MKIAVVDDEKIWTEKIKNQLVEILGNKVKVEIFHSGEGFLESKKEYDIVFMDIEMEGKDGFTTIAEYKKIYDECINIILTTHTEMSRQGYRVDAFRYIDKANLKEEMREALLSVKKLQARNVKINLTLKSLGKVRVDLQSILYFETSLRDVKVHLKKGDYLCKEGISELALLLSDKGFYLTHRSYLVNMQWIKEFNKNEIWIQNGDRVILSSRRYQDFKLAYVKWKFGNANM